MDNRNYYTNKSFKNSLIVSCLIVICLVAILLTRGSEYASSGLFVGLPILIAWILGFIGIIQIIKGRKEKKSLKFFAALIINGLILAFFMTIIISNIIDVACAFI